jgi:HAD superfamily hydrolase (TIGR01459 family)
MTIDDTPSPGAIPVLTSISQLASGYEAWLADVWGVIHNGVTPFTAACDACVRFRLSGGLVILLSNAPRPFDAVAAQLARIGVPDFAFDAIVSSGDAARQLIASAGISRIFHLGPERDLGLYTGLSVELVSAEAASLVVCSGLFDDDVETPDDYTEMLSDFARRGIPMICANPDKYVERGSKLIYCAGALAEKFQGLGARVEYAGKPHLPIYDMAFARLADLKGRAIARDRTLAIGDGLLTDIAGAAAAGVPSIYIASSVHMKPGESLDGTTLARLFNGLPSPPIAAMPNLSW